MKYLTTAFLLAAAQGAAQSINDLGTLGGDSSYASAISASGAVVVGVADNASNQRRSFLWTSAGLTDLGSFGGNDSFPFAVSADGSVVVGHSYNVNDQ